MDGRKDGHTYGHFDGHTDIRTDPMCIVIRDGNPSNFGVGFGFLRYRISLVLKNHDNI